ncbi:DUF4304 domain-containing protein [Heyndrickxia sporothermodurans]|uniref:DUF4304 domain-containing protein n=1 Tax=Heyndrickxia sporothermodurans TaxID=46224 RepID=UPI0015E6F272|nr:DUF4304 domain-containing protein [Heyndrickxia sporothermodurans]
MIVRSKIDKKIKRILSPVLKEFGFLSINSRNYYALHNDCIWVLNINHVGKYSSELSGWPAQSLNATVGIYYDFIPPLSDDIERIENFPKYYECQLQMELCCQNNEIYDQIKDNKKLESIWWFHPNGSNIEDVVHDIRNAFVNTGLPWLKKYSNLERAFEKIEGELNSYHKFYKAKFFAKYLNQWDKYEKYNHLFKVEATKFGE